MHLNKSSLIFISPLVLLISCSTSRSPKGNYCLSKNIGPDYAIITFANKTYKAKSWSDVAGEFTVEGSWNKIGDTIFLNPFKRGIIDTIIKTSEAIGENLEIKLINTERNKPLENVIIRSSEQEYISNEDGMVKIPKTKSGILFFTYHTIVDTLDISMLKGNVEVYINFEKLKSVKLPARWLLKGNRLIPVQKGYTSFKKC